VEFEQLIRRAMAVRRRYEQFEQARYGRPWTTEELALGLVGDVGDLTKLIVAHQGMRDIPDVERKLAHELSDCLWSILVLSHVLGVDLEDAFGRTMDELERYTALSSPV
jgi:NTP pyrophosphatase (non-canonical NTP hydrolase)